MENSTIPVEHMSVDNVAALSEKETKQYLTPFAFKMDNSLFGLPLATPTKRGVALLIDLLLVALLSDIPGVLLALAIAITLYYLGNKKRAQDQNKTKGRKRRATMRFIAASMAFIILLSVLPALFKLVGIEEGQHKDSVDNNSLSLSQSLSIGAITLSTLQKIHNSHCKKIECWQVELTAVAANIANVSVENEINVAPTELSEIFTDIVQEIDLPKKDKEQLITAMQTSYDKEIFQQPSELIKNSENKIIKDSSVIEQPSKPINKAQTDVAIVLAGDESLMSGDTLEEKETNRQAYSLIAWLKGIINDLGLGFGWAMFYFTVSIALGKGQTLGKKLLKIKVIQLDGTPLSLWDSFGRYGGYGAGLATGLLGFIQIYWDPNKQAIHDKISATVVIDLNKARKPILD